MAYRTQIDEAVAYHAEHDRRRREATEWEEREEITHEYHLVFNPRFQSDKVDVVHHGIRKDQLIRVLVRLGGDEGIIRRWNRWHMVAIIIWVIGAEGYDGLSFSRLLLPVP